MLVLVLSFCFVANHSMYSSFLLLTERCCYSSQLDFGVEVSVCESWKCSFGFGMNFVGNVNFELDSVDVRFVECAWKMRNLGCECQMEL